MLVHPSMPAKTVPEFIAYAKANPGKIKVPGYEASGWSGFGSPKSTPPEVIDKLNREINTALADLKIKAQLADLGATPLVGSPTDFGKLIAEETEKWGKVIRAAN
jgi:tripartite-type tricarboxylate transporter receptor subunit TctC